MAESMMNESKIRQLGVGLVVKVATVIALLAVGRVSGIPTAILAAGGLAILVALIAIRVRNRLNKKQFVGLLWFAAGAAVLCCLFAVREYVTPIQVSVVHIAVLLLPPALMMGSGAKRKNH